MNSLCFSTLCHSILPFRANRTECYFATEDGVYCMDISQHCSVALVSRGLPYATTVSFASHTVAGDCSCHLLPTQVFDMIELIYWCFTTVVFTPVVSGSSSRRKTSMGGRGCTEQSKSEEFFFWMEKMKGWVPDWGENGISLQLLFTSPCQNPCLLLITLFFSRGYVPNIGG